MNTIKVADRFIIKYYQYFSWKCIYLHMSYSHTYWPYISAWYVAADRFYLSKWWRHRMEVFPMLLSDPLWVQSTGRPLVVPLTKSHFSTWLRHHDQQHDIKFALYSYFCVLGCDIQAYDDCQLSTCPDRTMQILVAVNQQHCVHRQHCLCPDTKTGD